MSFLKFYWQNDLNEFSKTIDNFLLSNIKCTIVVGANVFADLRMIRRKEKNSSIIEADNVVEDILNDEGTIIKLNDKIKIKAFYLGLKWGLLPIYCGHKIDNNEVYLINEDGVK